MDREQILDELRHRIDTSGGTLTQTIKSLADELGVKLERMYYLIRSFEQQGLISAVNHGPNGMEFRHGSGVPKAQKTAAKGGGRRRAAAAPAAEAAPAQAAPAGRGPRVTRAAAGVARFCVWCGKPTHTEWRYCASCGEKLPVAR